VLEPHGTTLECGEEGEKIGVRDSRRKFERRKLQKKISSRRK